MILDAPDLFTNEHDSMADFNNREVLLTLHVDRSIQRACNDDSSLPALLTHDSVVEAHLNTSEKLIGFSGYRFRHMMNNICSLSAANYLEVGTYKGSTLVSAVSGNESSLASIYAIDNFSEFSTETDPKHGLIQNIERFLPNAKINFYEEDCFKFDVKKLPKIDVFFYDGEHSEEAQYKAFVHFYPSFADTFIAVIDDWEQEGVRRGTRRAWEELDFDIVSSRAIIPGTRTNPFEAPSAQWWNGTHIAVLRKKK